MVDEKLTKYLAELSMLSFTDTELTKLTEDMKDIIALMDTIKDTEHLEGSFVSDAVDYDNLRHDIVESSFGAEEIVKNAKNKKDNTFTVPKVF